MAEIMKKKGNEVIQKVHLKMACKCSCYATCPCSCSVREGKGFTVGTTEHGTQSADLCAQAYYQNKNKSSDI